MDLIPLLLVGGVALLLGLLAFAQIQSNRRKVLEGRIDTGCPECGGQLYPDKIWIHADTEEALQFLCAECGERYDKQDIEQAWVQHME